MESHLITGNSWFRVTWEEFARGVLGKLRFKFRILEAGYDKEMEPVPAFVNHGNWLVFCPKCHGAEYAFEEEWFFCCSCKNSYMGHKYRRLIFPKDRAAIEKLLVVRPLLNRNWQPGESLEKLRQENETHADELLVGRG